MGLKFTQSKKYKMFMGYVYGWGACVVIIGTLFKITHFPGAVYVLTAGMIVEAAIFFLSAFEPALPHYDWAKVFPELSDDFKGEVGNRSFGGGGNANASLSLDVIDDDTKNKIQEGLRKLASSVENVKDISESAIASTSYKEAMISATDAMNKVSQNSTKVSSQIEGLNTAIVSSSAGFEKISSAVDGYSGFIDNFQKNFKDNSETFNGNISTLNAIYEMQIKNTNEYLDSFYSVHKNVKNIAEQVTGTVESSKLYREEAEKLGKNISNLNDVYGNMLSVFNNTKN